MPELEGVDEILRWVPMRDDRQSLTHLPEARAVKRHFILLYILKLENL